MGQESDCHVNSSLREEMQRRIQHVEDRPEELRDLENAKSALLTSRLEAHRNHSNQVITREALEAKWRAKWNWKPQ